jgi:hypothetical protein
MGILHTTARSERMSPRSFRVVVAVRVLLTVFGATALAACGDDVGHVTDASHPGGIGGDGQPCYANDTCDSGFVCQDSTCAPQAQGGDGLPCRPDGSCDAGLVCTSSTLCLACEPGTRGCSCGEGGNCLARLTCEAETCREMLPLPGAPPLPGWSAALEAACRSGETWADVETSSGCGGSFSADEKRRSKPVGLLHWDQDLAAAPGADPKTLVTDVRWCSGVLLGERLFLTSALCFDRDKVAALGWTLPPNVESPSDFCAHLHVDFAYQVQAETGEVYENGGHAGTSYRCERVVEMEGGGVPYVLLSLEGCPGKTYGAAKPGTTLAAPDAPFEVLHHPYGQPKSVSCGTVLSVTDDLLTYEDAEVAGASTGAGIFHADGSLAGMHVYGGCSGTSSAYGIPIARIVNSSLVLPDLLFDPEAPLVVSVTPLQAAEGMDFTFTAAGANLPQSVWAEVAGCTDLKVVSSGPSAATFACLASGAGAHDGRVLSAEGGEPLFEFTVEVRDEATHCSQVCKDVTCGQVGPCDCGACSECGACGELERCVDDTCETDCAAACAAEKVGCGSLGDCDCGTCVDFQSCEDGACVVDCATSCETAHRTCGAFGACSCGSCGRQCGTCCDGACVVDCACLCVARGVTCGEVEGCACGTCPVGEECRNGTCQVPGVVHRAYWVGNNCILAGQDAMGCVETTGFVGEAVYFTVYDDDDNSAPETGPTFEAAVAVYEFDDESEHYVTCFLWEAACGGIPGYCVDGGNEGDEAEFYFAVNVGGKHFESTKTWTAELNVGDGFVPSGDYCHY